MQSLVMLNTSSTSHPNSLVMLVVVSRAPVPCYADRVWPNPLHVVCGPTGGNVEEMVSTSELHQCSVALD